MVTGVEEVVEKSLGIHDTASVAEQLLATS
jgi:hypothetical protein